MVVGALPGTYVIKAKYYSSHQRKLEGGTTVMVTVLTKFGSSMERKQVQTIRLTENKESIEVFRVDI